MLVVALCTNVWLLFTHVYVNKYFKGLHVKVRNFKFEYLTMNRNFEKQNEQTMLKIICLTICNHIFLHFVLKIFTILILFQWNVRYKVSLKFFSRIKKKMFSQAVRHLKVLRDMLPKLSSYISKLTNIL